MARWAELPEDRTQAVLFADRLDDAVPPDHAMRLVVVRTTDREGKVSEL